MKETNTLLYLGTLTHWPCELGGNIYKDVLTETMRGTSG